MIVRATFFFRWFDFWIGVYYDVPGRNLYICPVPMFGVKISWGKP